jgi:hypothetical protein
MEWAIWEILEYKERKFWEWGKLVCRKWIVGKADNGSHKANRKATFVEKSPSFLGVLLPFAECRKPII